MQLYRYAVVPGYSCVEMWVCGYHMLMHGGKISSSEVCGFVVRSD